MRTIAVVVVDELGQNLVQVGLADGNHVVKALLTDCPDPALGDRVGAGRPKRSPQTPDIDRECALAEGGAPDTVTVVDQISRLAVPGRGLDQLPPDPSGSGMGGYLEVDELAAAMTDEEEDVKGLEGQGLNNQEVGRPDRLSMIRKEDATALAGRSRRARPAVATYRARADHDAELEQFAADTLTAPERVLARHGGD